MSPWIRVLEAYLVQALLRTPAFHRGVEKVAKGVHRLRHGIPPEEMGGTKIDQPNSSSFLRHFTEEVQTQLGRAEAKTSDAAVKSESGLGSRDAARRTTEKEEENAEAVWRNAQRSSTEAPKQGFMGEYVGALKEQLKNGK